VDVGGESQSLELKAVLAMGSSISRYNKELWWGCHEVSDRRRRKEYESGVLLAMMWLNSHQVQMTNSTPYKAT
jgi:hypothetical protein